MPASKPTSVTELFAKDGTWCRYTMAVTADGIKTKSDAENARRWCLTGACALVYGHGTPAYEHAVYSLYKALRKRDLVARTTDPETAVTGWNDKHMRNINHVRIITREAQV